MRRLAAALLAATVLLAVRPMPAAAAPYAYIACYGGGVAVIDTATDTVTTTIPTAFGISGAAVAPGGARVYLTNQASSIVDFLDTATNSIVAMPAAGVVTPFGVDVDPTGTRLYVGASIASPWNVSVVSTATGAVLHTIPIGSPVLGVAAHPAGGKVYVTTPGLDRVSVVSTVSNLVIGTIPVGDSPQALAVNPAGTLAYVANSLGGTISVIDTTTDLVVDTISVGFDPFGIAVTPDGRTLYVSNYGYNSVSVVDLATRTVVATFLVGTQPYGVSVHPDGSKVYVTNFGSNNVSVIDTVTNEELYRVPVCGSPRGIGRFITGTQTTASTTAAATGTMTVTVSPSYAVHATLAFDSGPVSVFGTPVDVGAALGVVPMQGTIGLSPTSMHATSSTVPSFSLDGIGSVVPSGNSAYVTFDLATPTGTLLPSGPAYQLLAHLTGVPFAYYSGPFTITATLAANTPVGLAINVPVTTTVDLCPGATPVTVGINVAFSEVTAAGGTLVSAACQSPASIPPNIRLDAGTLQLFFDVSTTATYSGPITICSSYPDADQDGLVDIIGIDELTLRILHDDSGGNFQPPVNQFVDPVLNRVCAEVDHLSPFLIAAEGVAKGFVAPDDAARACENALPKLSAKLLKAMITCTRRAAGAALKDKSFDRAACAAAAQTKYDDKVAQFGSCPACATGNAGGLRTATESLAAGLEAGLYCAGTSPLPSGFGLVPPSADAASCAKAQGVNLAKLGKALGQCYRKLADAAFAQRAFDADACVAAATAAFDAASAARTGCGACAVANAATLRNQVERFALGALSDIYCAGTTPLP